MTPLRLGVIGAGQVWRRLYQPALRRTNAFEIAAIADPATNGAATFETPERMLETSTFDCVAVLSPPSLHSEHVLRCLERNLPVLVEKPPALATTELDAWVAAGGSSLVRPAFARRYWTAYQHAGRNGHEWKLDLQTSPASWEAVSVDPVAQDLLPHAIDLARWLSGEEITSLRVLARADDHIRAEAALSGGGTFSWNVAHGTAYREELRLDGRRLKTSESLTDRLRQRLLRQPPRDVAAITAMLNDWALALAGAHPTRLPTLADARANVDAIERLLAAPIEEAA